MSNMSLSKVLESKDKGQSFTKKHKVGPRGF
jgi:hypothetical protein